LIQFQLELKLEGKKGWNWELEQPSKEVALRMSLVAVVAGVDLKGDS